MTAKEDRPPCIFLSYSHKDWRYRDALNEHLGVIEKHHGIAAWTDRSIRGGEDWLAELKAKHRAASLLVLIVTPNSLRSDFILHEEVGEAIRAAKRIYPILFRDCAWRSVDWLNERQMRPAPLVPLMKLRKADRDTALASICEEMLEILRDQDSKAAKRAPPERRAEP